MGKAIEGAAMLGAAVGMGALAFFNPALLASPLFDKVWASLILGGISMEAGAIAQALTQNRGTNITTRQPASFRQVIYGTQRVGGVMVYASTTGKHKDQYNRVIVLAGHEINAIESLYLDGRLVYWDVGSPGNMTRNGVNFGGSANGTGYSGPNGQRYNFGGLVYCEYYAGDQTSAPNTTPGGGFSTGLQANDRDWTPSSSGTPYLGGCAYAYLKIEYDENMFPSDPEIRFTVQGKNTIYDPRTGTKGYSDNWALIVNDVLTDPQFGLGLDYSTWINNAQLIAAANVCDESVACAAGTESRYKCHFHYDTSLDPGSVLETMMPGAAGRLSFIAGEYYIWPAYWQGPSFTFDQTNVTSDSLTWNPQRPFRDRFNVVNGTYIAPNYPYNVAGNYYDSNGFYDGTMEDNFPFAFQPTNYPQYAEDALHGYSTNAYLAQDSGIYLPKELGQQTVLSIAQAQRVAKIFLERNRQQGNGAWGMGLECFDMQEMDVMEFTFSAMGWSEKYLETQGVQFSVSDGSEGGSPSIKLNYTFAETAASVYEWSVTEELSPYDVPAIPTGQSYTPDPPTDMTLTSGAVTAVQTADGVVHPRIEVQWDAPPDILTKQIQVQYAPTLTPSPWIDNGLVDVANTLAYIPGVVAGTEYNVRIRGLRASGGASAWVEIDGYVVSLTLSVVGIVELAPGSLVGLTFPDGTAGVIVKGFVANIGNSSVQVLPAGPVTLLGLPQQTLEYVYYIDPTFVGGAITPIATTNAADFENKPGYFLIDSIVTGYQGSSGVSSGMRYAPSSYSDLGSQSTGSPAQAYDGTILTGATVGGTSLAPRSMGGSSPTTSGNCIYAGFPAIASTSGMKLYVVAAVDAIAGGTAIVSALGSSLLNLSTTADTATYCMAIPAATMLNTLAVQCTAVPLTATSTVETIVLFIYEIYVQ